MRLRAHVTVGFGAAVLASAIASAQSGAPVVVAGTTLSGVYSQAQAKRGADTFKKSCLECHVPSEYTGETFTSKFVGGTAFDVYELIRSSMPQNDPGSLTGQQYTDLVAYLFEINGLPTREAELPMVIDSLKAIKVEVKAPRSRHLKGATTAHGSSRIR